ncbi:MAG: hypothetical protein R6W31_02115, partial [Bacteroidales bacterium]
TARGVYGISPADPAGFLGSLDQHHRLGPTHLLVHQRHYHVHANVTFSGMNWVSLSEGAYFGILDFPVTRKFIVKSITNESLSVALFICAYWSDPAGSGNLPTWLYHLTFVPKE